MEWLKRHFCNVNAQGFRETAAASSPAIVVYIYGKEKHMPLCQKGVLISY
jgi:hypothetical protein